MSAKVTAKAVSQISEQLPSFIGEDFTLYEKFVKNYYEFLETVCVYYDIVEGYENAFSFTMGETVTGQTSGATAKVKGTGANSGTNKLFLEPTNTLDFVEEFHDVIYEILTCAVFNLWAPLLKQWREEGEWIEYHSGVVWDTKYCTTKQRI